MHSCLDLFVACFTAILLFTQGASDYSSVSVCVCACVCVCDSPGLLTSTLYTSFFTHMGFIGTLDKRIRMVSANKPLLREDSCSDDSKLLMHL